jgi:hypothetical protein
MNKTTKIAALTAAALVAAALSSQAAQTTPPGDLLIGIYNSSVGQTFVFDIGQFSSLTLGKTWNLDSLSGGQLFGAPGTLGAGGQYTSGGAGFNASTLAGAHFGVVGYDVSGTDVNHIFYTAPGAKADLSNTDGGSWGGAVDGIPTGVYQRANSFQTDWQSITTGTTSAGGTYDALGGFNVNGTQGSQLFLYTGTAFATSGQQVKDSFFTLGTDGTLTYGAAVPEPGVYGLFAGAGLLVLSLRNQFRRKQA